MTGETMESKQAEVFDEWCIVELMGHRKLGGRVTEQVLAGAAFVRIDVPGKDGTVATQLYGPSAIYCITPVAEAIARQYAAGCRVEPVTRWELPQLAPADDEDDFDGR